MSSIDLNADLGETVGGVPTADDEAMFALISSANVACGAHAGDETSMRASVARAERFGVAIGAHPSYDDRPNFGRTARSPAPEALRQTLRTQLGALRDAGADIRYVKPHGALYNRIVVDPAQARIVAETVAAFAEELGRTLPILGLGGMIEDATVAAGLPFVGEAFLDRGYAADGTLVPRDHPAALLHESERVAERSVRLVRDGLVETVDGTVIGVDAASFCLHGDTPSAVAMARAVRAALVAEGVAIRAPW